MPRPEFKPKQSLGQNFLVDPNIAASIVRSFNLTPDDFVLEIGPGLGVLTEIILPQVKTLLAVEIDNQLAPKLEQRFTDNPVFQLVHQDFLKFDMNSIQAENIRVIGNIPYNITSPILFKIMDWRGKVKDLTMLIQKEVALRVVSQPNSKDYGILAVMSQVYADVKLLLNVPRTVFNPRPKVESSLVRWSFHNRNAESIKDHELFRTLVRQAFGQRRKMLRNSLKDYYEKNPDIFDFTKRPEQLSIPEWIQLVNSCYDL